MPICFIGTHGVEEVTHEGDFSHVKFTSGETLVIHRKLFDKIVSPASVDTGGDPRDIVCANIAQEVIALMIIYNIPLGDFGPIIKMTENKMVSLKQAADARKWNGKDLHDITFGEVRDVLTAAA